MNKVILVGGNHHNGLGLVRSFGVNGIFPYGILVGEGAEKSFVRKSKYWKKTWAVSSESKMLSLLKEQFSHEQEKPVVIPWSDGAAEIIDQNLDELSKCFILPSISNKQGEIVRLMDKQEQTKFAKEHGIKMLESEIVDCTLESVDNPLREYPVILKPVASVEGEKMDIQICYNSEEYQEAIKSLKKKFYKRILVQKYLTKRTEYILTGAVTKTHKTFSVVQNIRRWPKEFGCGSFSQYSTDDLIVNYAIQIIDIIQKFGYEGTIDIDFFKGENESIYLNEINWRSGGRNYVGLYNEVFSPYQYYCSIIGVEVVGEQIGRKGGYTMNETTDLRHVIYGSIKLREWIGNARQTHNFAVWYGKDLKPTFVRYGELVKKIIGLK